MAAPIRYNPNSTYANPLFAAQSTWQGGMGPSVGQIRLQRQKQQQQDFADNQLLSMQRALERERQLGITGFQDYLTRLLGPKGSPMLSSEFVNTAVNATTAPLDMALQRRIGSTFESAAARGLNRYGAGADSLRRRLESERNLQASQARTQALLGVMQQALPAIGALSDYRASVPISNPAMASAYGAPFTATPLGNISQY